MSWTIMKCAIGFLVIPGGCEFRLVGGDKQGDGFRAFNTAKEATDWVLAEMAA